MRLYRYAILNKLFYIAYMPPKSKSSRVQKVQKVIKIKKSNFGIMTLPSEILLLICNYSWYFNTGSDFIKYLNSPPISRFLYDQVQVAKNACFFKRDGMVIIKTFDCIIRWILHYKQDILLTAENAITRDVLRFNEDEKLSGNQILHHAKVQYSYDPKWKACSKSCSAVSNTDLPKVKPCTSCHSILGGCKMCLKTFLIRKDKAHCFICEDLTTKVDSYIKEIQTSLLYSRWHSWNKKICLMYCSTCQLNLNCSACQYLLSHSMQDYRESIQNLLNKKEPAVPLRFATV